ncbi:translation initiation factor EIF-2b alpha subunit [Plasmodium gonderi]|uniref:Translation initiation factor eIF2B subunit alpha n=1 Tax=Plasmodium gonderi TaxID=77519 RepID=A0A1Y1JAR4_PLAGO|nr:translation initiation factor EIF-2b alpha subunit [Plasmodium gonderi]GAW79621.1 translation initiation factor EIF-2b alpha subunit [Plasmodium gonderi]
MDHCEYTNEEGDVLEEHEVVRTFKKHYFDGKDEMHIAAIKAIAQILQSNSTKTNFELFINLSEAKMKLNNFLKNKKTQKEIIAMPHSKRMTIYPILSSSDIYLHFLVKKYTHNENNFSNMKSLMTRGANNFPESVKKSLTAIGNRSNSMFINRKTTILTHSNSECVKSLLLNVVKNQMKQVSVYFTSTEYICEDYLKKDKNFDDKFIQDLQKENIKVTKIHFNNVKDILGTIDFVVIGTELVFDNGGIINKKGIKVLAELCSLNKKEFYVACEAYKFLKIERIKNWSHDLYSYCTKNIATEAGNFYEFLPHHFITLFYTDIGIFPPSAISYELNQIYINDAI